MRVSKSSHYEFNNEMFSAITHAFALGLAVTGTIALGIKGVNSGSQVELFSLLGFGVSLMLLYTASTAFHGFYFSKARHVLQVLDHSGVFILIAGSYLPYCLVAIGGKLGIGLLIAIWALCLGGIAYKLFFLNRFKHLETMIYVVLGWLCLVGMVPLWHHLGPVGFLVASRRWCGLYRRGDALSAKRHPLHPRYLAPLCDSRQPVHVLIYLFLSVK
ncbi:Hemolysin III related protein [Lacticaseibacillus rhamnosus Lc 705]|nr:Hemolysin III related protein [Lacticaseibacillus rhamnosus Lc 705]